MTEMQALMSIKLNLLIIIVHTYNFILNSKQLCHFLLNYCYVWPHLVRIYLLLGVSFYLVSSKKILLDFYVFLYSFGTPRRGVEVLN